MMAAMAQQDCGQCGYNCEDYSNALFLEQGGAAEPVRARRQGNRAHAEDAVRGASAAAGRRSEDGARQRRCYGCTGHRAGPFARQPADGGLPSRARCLNKAGSEKETWHIEFDLAGTGLDYTVGDSFGVFPANDPALVDAVIARARRAGR